MAERVEQLAGGSLGCASRWISTFHSFCVRVLRRDIESPAHRQHGLSAKTSPSTTSPTSRRWSRPRCAASALTISRLTPRNVLARISWAKNHMLDPQEVYLQSADPEDGTDRAHLRDLPAGTARRPTRSISTTCCSKPCGCSKSTGEVREQYNRRFSTCWSTNIRTPTARSTS